MKFAPIDFLIVVAYMTIVVSIALRSRRFAAKSLDNYFLAGRNMPGWMTGISYAASMVSADSAVGYGGLAAVTGVYAAWFYLSRFGVALFIGAVLFAVYWRRLNTFTTLEFYELRFEGLPGKLIHLWLALRTSLIAIVAWTGISLLALVKISQPVLGWGKTETIALAIPLAAFYVWCSGYLGVVLGNLVQVLVMAVGSLVLAWRVLSAVGGPHQLYSRLAGLGGATLPSFPPAHDALFPAVACVAWLIGASIGYGGDAAPLSGAVEGQRILSSSSPREACKMYVVAEVTMFTLVWLLSIPCLAAPLFWPQLRSGGLDRELAYGLLMTRFLPAGLLGLVYVAVLGGIVSVVGDNLNFGAQVLLNDIYRRHLVKHATERHYLLAGRLAILVILGLALLVVYKVTFVMNVAIFMVGLSATEMSANWAQWWWWRFNGWGRVAASLGGGLFYLLLALLCPGLVWWDRMLVSMVFSTVLWLAATLLTAPERDDRLIAFYRRARPLGSWTPIRRRCGSLADSAQGGLPILIGLVLAATGAIAVMAYIFALSRLYLGQYSSAIYLLTAMAACGIAFWFGAARFFDGLLFPAERSEIQLAQIESKAAGDRFGVLPILSWVCFATAIVIGAQWLFLGGRRMSCVFSLAFAALGLLLTRMRVRNATLQ